MASIVVAGDTSGTVTLAAPAVSGTTTLTLPTANGTLVTTASGQTLTSPTISGVSTFAAGTAAAPAITTTGDTNTGIFFPAADTIAFAEGGTEAMRLDSSGNVGIGTTSPTAGLNVYKSGSWTVAGASTYPYPAGNVFLQAGGVASQNNWIGITGNYNTSTGSANILLQANIQDTSQQAGNYIGSEATSIGNASLTFGRMIGGATVGANATKSEVMRIDSSGNLFVATTSFPSGSNQGIVLQANGVLQTSHNGTIAAYRYLFSAGTFEEFRVGATTVGSISSNGSTTTYGSSSDYRLKENIAPMTGALDKVAQLKPVTYTWKDGGSIGQGFIAHELQAVVPDCVTGEKDAVENYTDEDGIEKTRPKYQGVDTSFLVATLTAAIQEMKAIIDAQSVIINDLKARVETLEAK
jgi:hypothetical protein